MPRYTIFAAANTTQTKEGTSCGVSPTTEGYMKPLCVKCVCVCLHESMRVRAHMRRKKTANLAKQKKKTGVCLCLYMAFFEGREHRPSEFCADSGVACESSRIKQTPQTPPPSTWGGRIHRGKGKLPRVLETALQERRAAQRV